MEHLRKKILDRISNQIEEQSSKMNFDGSVVYELEADATIPSEYILLMHFLGDINIEIQEKIKSYLLRIQNKEGGWPLFYDGGSDISASVKAYYALKLAGQPIQSEQMKKANKLILELGGAENVNVFTRITLALFKQISWNTVPTMPIEIMNLPNWFPFNLKKVSYWSRTVIVPLLIIMNKKPIANNPHSLDINELFIKNPRTIKNLKKKQGKNFWTSFFLMIDKILRKIEPLFPKQNRKLCLKKAYDWTKLRLNGSDGLGAIFPAMVNSLIAFHIDEQNKYSKEKKTARTAIDKLLVIKKNEAYCQPCVSPIWDTGWVAHCMLENNKNIDKTVEWLLKKEIKVKGDWSHNKLDLEPGGWAFQYNNDYYPDVDDTALIGMLLHRYNVKKKKKDVSKSIKRTRQWIKGMQSKNGGWGSFDINNDYSYLNYIPFADHGALLDPPTADVSARCLSFLLQLNNPKDRPEIDKALRYLLLEQEKNGSWFGRWGTNYIYGTWSVLSAIKLIDFPEKKEVFKKAIRFIKSKQKPDGGWGEDGKSYEKGFEYMEAKFSTPSQTAWAVMSLISCGEGQSQESVKGIEYLLKHNCKDEKFYTAVGFPRVFYLKYHGYADYFPLLAIVKFKNLSMSNSKTTLYGV